jgi:polyisoprenoid-binding protein YceI
MKTPIILFLAIIFLISCNGNSPDKNISDSADSSAVVKNNEPPKPKRDSISIDLTKSKFDCTRSKTVKDVDKVVKLFGADVNVKMDNASFSSTVNIKILNGHWFSLDKKFDGGKVVLDMKSVATVNVGKDKELEMSNPDYLNVEKYPTATLFIERFDSIPGNKKQLNVVAKLQLKDSIADVSFPAKAEYENADQVNPSKLVGDFHINGIKWGLNHKNAKVLKDDLLFHVVLVAEKN